MTNQEVEGIKGHFDKVSEELRRELRGEISEVRHYTGVVAENLRSDIRAVAEGVALANERLKRATSSFSSRAPSTAPLVARRL